MDIPRLKDRHRLKSQPPNMTFLKAKHRGTKLTFYHSLKGASNWTSRGLKIDTSKITPFFEGGQQLDIPRLKDRHRLKSRPPNMTFLKAKQRGTKLTFYHSLKGASNWTSKHDVFEGKTERHEAYVLPFFEGGQQLDIPRLKDRHRLKSQPPNMTFLKAKQRGTKLTFYHSLKGASNWTSRGLKIDTV